MNKVRSGHVSNKAVLDPALLVIAVLPWILMLLHINWPLPGLDFDSLFMWGLYHTYDVKVPLITATTGHYFSRLGATLPGYAVFHSLPALWATYALNFGYWYTAVFSMYYTVKLMVNQKTAFFAAILMGSYPWLLSAFSAGFTDGPAISYLSLTLLLLALAAKRPFWKMWLVAAGMSFAGAVHSNIFVLNFVPVYAAFYFLAVNREDRKNPVVPSVLFMALGFVTVTLLIGAINLYHGGQFWFFEPSVKAAINYSRRPPSKNPAYFPVYITILSNRHLLLPIVVLASGLLFLWFNRKDLPTMNRRPARMVQLLYLFTFIIYLVFEIRGNISPMQSPQYAGYMLPVMFLALGAQFDFAGNLRRKLFWWLAGSGVLFIVLSRLLYDTFLSSKKNFGLTLFKNSNPFYGLDYSGINLLIFLTGIAVLIIFYIMQSRRPAPAIAIIIVFIGLIYSFMPNTLGARLSMDQFLAVEKGRALIADTPVYFNQHRQRFWLDKSSPQTPVYRVITGIFGGYYDFFKWPDADFEKMPDSFKLQSINSQGGRPKSGEVLLILTDNPEVMSQAQQSLSSIDLTGRLIKAEKIEQGSLRYFMTFVRVEDKP